MRSFALIGCLVVIAAEGPSRSDQIVQLVSVAEYRRLGQKHRRRRRPARKQQTTVAALSPLSAHQAANYVLIADGYIGQAGCAADSVPATGYTEEMTSGLEACKDNCKQYGCVFIQYHKSGWCGLFTTCSLTRPASEYSSKARVYKFATLYERYSSSCWEAGGDMASRDASCEGDLLCSRVGYDNRHFGDCVNQHCCSQACAWTTHVDKYSGGLAGGVHSSFSLTEGKKACIELGSTCKAITCHGNTCTMRASASLSHSPSGETTYVPSAGCFEVVNDTLGQTPTLMASDKYCTGLRKAMDGEKGFGFTLLTCSNAVMNDPACKSKRFDFNQVYNGQCQCALADCTSFIKYNGYNVYTAPVSMPASTTRVPRFYKFTPTRTRSLGFQLSEISFKYNGSLVDTSGVMSTYAGNYGGGSPGNAFDGDTNTKVCCKAHPVVVEFPTPTPIDAYSFTTGNDVPARDPVQWTLEASEDGAKYYSLHEQNSDYATPLARRTKTPWFDFTQMCYESLEHVLTDDGNNLRTIIHTTVDGCKSKCTSTARCHSFTSCATDGRCYLKDQVVASSDDDYSDGQQELSQKTVGDCRTYYKAPCQACSSSSVSITPARFYSGHVEPIRIGMRAWDDRLHTLGGSIALDMQGSSLHRLAYHKDMWKSSALTLSSVAGTTIFVCFEPGPRDCGYSTTLPINGFTKLPSALTWGEVPQGSTEVHKQTRMSCHQKRLRSSVITLPKITTTACVQIVAVKCLGSHIREGPPQIESPALAIPGTLLEQTTTVARHDSRQVPALTMRSASLEQTTTVALHESGEKTFGGSTHVRTDSPSQADWGGIFEPLLSAVPLPWLITGASSLVALSCASLACGAICHATLMRGAATPELRTSLLDSGDGNTSPRNARSLKVTNGMWDQELPELRSEILR